MEAINVILLKVMEEIKVNERSLMTLQFTFREIFWKHLCHMSKYLFICTHIDICDLLMCYNIGTITQWVHVFIMLFEY